MFFITFSSKEPCRCFKSIAAVKIISIDNGEGPVDDLFCAKYRVSRTPGFGPSFRRSKSIGKRIHFLENIFRSDTTLPFGFEDRPEIIGKLFPDDKNYLPETGTDRIKDGIIHDSLTRWPKS